MYNSQLKVVGFRLKRKRKRRGAQRETLKYTSSKISNSQICETGSEAAVKVIKRFTVPF